MTSQDRQAPEAANEALHAPGWELVTPRAPWRPRDSQGEVVHAGHMWIMGGWFDSYQPAPRDVWRSADGKTWECVTEAAPWTHGDLPMTLTFAGKMWFMGGWYNGRLPGHSASNQVWASVDGVQWELVTERAPWSPRAYHQAVVFADKIWVLGGGNYVPNHQAKNDVWVSEDGVEWTLVTAAAPWAPRLWFSAVVYRERLWVLGGWSQAQDNFGDVWCSADGENWVEVRSPRIWSPRHEHSAFVFQDKLWVAGGHARPLSSEVWSLALPGDFFAD